MGNVFQRRDNLTVSGAVPHWKNAIYRLCMKSKKKVLFFGLLFITVGIFILCFFGYKHISREIQKQQLLKTSIVLDIPSVDIYVPVVEGIDGDNLHIAAGHFENTGAVGSGNFCIAGHNSTIYAEIFNTLSEVEVEDKIYLINNDANHTTYTYTVSKIDIVEPEDTWILQDYGDDRITIVTCTDDGERRMVVTGMKVGE